MSAEGYSEEPSGLGLSSVCTNKVVAVECSLFSAGGVLGLSRNILVPFIIVDLHKLRVEVDSHIIQLRRFFQ